jgi:hypothetical protein
MKKIFTFLIAIFILVNVFAQAPQKMSYQTVVRNSDGALVDSANVGIKISLLQGSANGVAVYVETHNAMTNANGLASLEIGTGTTIKGAFDSINWANGHYFLKTETDPTGGANYTIIGTSQLLSVPYALYAENVNTSLLNTSIYFHSTAYLDGGINSMCGKYDVDYDQSFNYRVWSFLVPRNGQIKNLLVTPTQDTVALGSIVTCEILLNGVSTPLSLTLTNADGFNFKSDTTTKINVIQGDFIAFQWIRGSIKPGTRFQASVELK